MELFITDREDLYLSHKGERKLLYTPCQFNRSTFLNASELEQLNVELSNVEYEAAELMLKRLKSDCQDLYQKKIAFDRFLSTRAPYDRMYSLLYYASWNVLLPSYAFSLCVKKFLASRPREITRILLYVSDRYESIKGILNDPGDLFRYQFYGEKGRTFSKAFKNIFYAAHRFLRPCLLRLPKIRREQKHIVMFLYDIPSVHSVMTHFIDLAKQHADSVFLSIVEISTGVANANRETAAKYAGGNVAVFRFEDFRAPLPLTHDDLYTILEDQDSSLYKVRKQDPFYDMALKYAWVDETIKKLKPSLAMYLGVLEHGRAISDVCRYYEVPTVNVEYAMFTDDPLFMESNIEFSVRACISQNSSDIWKKRADPTLKHVITGYGKLDHINTDHYSKARLFEKYGLDTGQKTICFASTWSGGFEFNTLEKTIWMKRLSDLCHRNKWNLIIKKHPAESDTIAEEIVGSRNFPNQVVFSNKEVDTYEVIFCSDLLCTQSSGIVVEGLCFNKPFCYLSVNSANNKRSINPLAAEPGVHTFFTEVDLEKYITGLFAGNEDESSFAELKEKYLFKCDGRASQRLLDLVTHEAK